VDHVAGISTCLTKLGAAALWQGDYALAHTWLREGLELERGLSVVRLAINLLWLGTLALRQSDYEQAQSYLEESVYLSAESGNTFSRLWGLTNLGYVALRRGNPIRAYALFLETQQRFNEARNKGGVIYALEGLASLAVAQGQLEQAVHLFGWADTARQAIDAVRPPVEQASVERDFVLIRAQLDEAAIEAARAEGQAMTMEQAIAYGLEQARP
jgi:tetratricopeptide (TPR) repeat protein